MTSTRPPLLWLDRASFWLLYAALFTIGWDRIANIGVIGFNVKLPVILLAISLVTTATALIWQRRFPRLNALLTWLVCGAVGLMLVSAAFAYASGAALLQIGTVVLGAVVPCLAVFLHVHLRRSAVPALRSFVAGGVAVALFGIYQFVAGIVGWPQVVEYTALGGGVARISSTLYEAGYFGYYIVLVIGAVAALQYLRPRVVYVALIIFLVAVLLLANTRAAFITLPLVLVLLYAPAVFRAVGQAMGRLSGRQRLIRVLSVVAALAVILVTVALLFPHVVRFLFERASTILDPGEPTSNAPRLAAAEMFWRIILNNPVLGIGPGNLYFFAQRYGADVTGLSTNTTIANNAYLQALLDAGPLLLVLQLAIAAVFILKTFRFRFPVSRSLTAGWIAVAAVAFIGTSFFWDLKLWAIMGLSLAASRFHAVNAGRVGAHLHDDPPTSSETERTPQP